MTRLLVLTVLAGIVPGLVMLGWLYEGPRRLLRIAACYIGRHGGVVEGVNSEPMCLDCRRFLAKVY
jgi:hypothetical protein